MALTIMRTITLCAALFLFSAAGDRAHAQMMQVIPAPSTATADASSLSAEELISRAEAILSISSAAPAQLQPAKPAKTGKPSQPAQYGEIRTPLSGIVMMPTAYRGRGKNSIGLGLDINAAYFIGRLYGKNRYEWTVDKKNYLDRIGVWLLMADAKMQIQTEGRLRPALAAGALGTLQFRDSPQPTLAQPGASVKVDSKNTATYTNAYLVLTKRLHRRVIVNGGYSDGDMPKMVYQLSEFLSKEALNLNGISNFTVPTGMLFGGLMWIPGSGSPIGIEVMLPQGAPQNPRLFNLHLGTLLKLNFEISYLAFKGGWDMLGMFQFRYNYFPR
ncbi:MAG TPA: hypothetical protein PL037_07220 [Elusimicrobiales bacterium]|nr:hypothetical protein [Elusimicrobiales bacterium]